MCSNLILSELPARRAVMFFLIAVLTYSTGCGSNSGPQRVIVEGRVTFNGEPVTNGDVMFYPTEKSPAPLAGGSIKDGKYVANARGGVPVGERRVEIRGYRAPKSLGNHPTGEGPPTEQYLPEKYNKRTELTIIVSAETNPMTLDFDLQSQELAN